MDFAGGTEATLAMTGGVTQAAGPLLGPCLHPGMGEVAMLERLNSWGVARDRELVDLRADLVTAQAGVSGAFGQAERALLGIATDWRLESEAMRQSGQREAAAAMSRLELVVGDARARFAAQDAARNADLSELGRRLSIIDGWAQAEPQRVNAQVLAEAARVPTSPGGTPIALTALGARAMGLYAQPPGLAAPQPQQLPWTQPQLQPLWAPGAQPQRPPQTPTQQQQQQQQAPPPQTPTPQQPPQQQEGTQDPWAAFAAGRAGAAPQHFHVGTPGAGAGRGSFPYPSSPSPPREMRLDGRS